MLDIKHIMDLPEVSLSRADARPDMYFTSPVRVNVLQGHGSVLKPKQLYRYNTAWKSNYNQ